MPFRSSCTSSIHDGLMLVILTLSYSTMGIFPIIMNILQFWLIDSIVKASSVSVVLVSDSTRNSADGDVREPLFASSEDEDDYASSHQGHDIERPASRILFNSHSRSVDETPSNDKSSGPVSIPDAFYHSEVTNVTHSYPPSVSSSTRSRSISNPPKSSRKKRSRPPPISITASGQPAINSPQYTASRIVELQKVDITDDSSQEWASSLEDSDDRPDKLTEVERTTAKLQEIEAGLESPGKPPIEVES